jgi:hypothetical protein
VKSLLALYVAGSLAAACGGKTSASAGGVAPLPARPLAGLAGEPIIVLPVRFLRPADSLGWAAQVGDPRAFLARLDDEIAFAVRQRGAATKWTWPDELTRLARRNASFATDPHDVAAEPLRPRPGQRPVVEVRDPLASQLRSLVALRDARFALLPVEVRFEPAGGGTSGRAVLYLALVDARLATVVWTTQIASDTATAPTAAALPASLGERFADLVAAR